MKRKIALIAGYWEDGDEIPKWFRNSAVRLGYEFPLTQKLRPEAAFKYLEAADGPIEPPLILLCRRIVDKYTVPYLVERFSVFNPILIVYDQNPSAEQALEYCEISAERCAIKDYLWMGMEGSCHEHEIYQRVHAAVVPESPYYEKLGLKYAKSFAPGAKAFVSTPFDDGERAFAITVTGRALAKAGFQPDILGRYTQASVPENILAAIRGCSLVVANIAPSRPWVRREVLEAMIEERPMVLVHQIGKPVPPELEPHQRLEFRHEVHLALMLYHGLKHYVVRGSQNGAI